MNAKQVVAKIQQDIQGVRERGLNEIPVANLEKYLEEIQQNLQHADASEAQLEIHKIERTHDLLGEHEMFRSVVNAGQMALKNSLLVGGGAAAALLAFASSAWKGLKPEGLELLGLAVTMLAAGVVLTAFASGMNYVSQSLYHEAYGEDKPRHELAGHVANGISCGSVIAAYILYGLAGYKVYLMMQCFDVVKPLT